MVLAEVNFLFYVMFWTILAMMAVLLFALRQVIVIQRHIENLDGNIERLVKKVLVDEERILFDIEGPKKSKVKKAVKKKKKR